jgi:hypothetical protein
LTLVLGGAVKTRLIEPRRGRPNRTVREFRCPEDLDVFFHQSCAPRLTLPQELRDEITALLAKALIAQYEKTVERWAKVGRAACTEDALPRCQADVASAVGRRVFTMTRSEWERLRAHEGKVVEIDVERTPADGVGAAASAIAALAAECSVHTERIEVWRYNPKDGPTPHDVQGYLVLEGLTRRLNVPMFAERASSHDSPRLRKHLRENVFVVREQPDEGRWEAKARALEQIVFLSVGT